MDGKEQVRALGVHQVDTRLQVIGRVHHAVSVRILLKVVQQIVAVAHHQHAETPLDEDVAHEPCQLEGYRALVIVHLPLGVPVPRPEVAPAVPRVDGDQWCHGSGRHRRC